MQRKHAENEKRGKVGEDSTYEQARMRVDGEDGECTWVEKMANAREGKLDMYVRAHRGSTYQIQVSTIQMRGTQAPGALDELPVDAIRVRGVLLDSLSSFWLEHGGDRCRVRDGGTKGAGGDISYARSGDLV